MSVHKKRVLIVDDDDQSRVIFAGHLRSLGFETVFSSNGEDALFMLAGDSRFDLIIADLIMPEMTGFEFTQKLKDYSKLSKIPVIGTSACHDWQRTIDKRDLIADGFIAKPVEREALMKELDRVLMGK